MISEYFKSLSKLITTETNINGLTLGFLNFLVKLILNYVFSLDRAYLGP